MSVCLYVSLFAVRRGFLGLFPRLLYNPKRVGVEDGMQEGWGFGIEVGKTIHTGEVEEEEEEEEAKGGIWMHVGSLAYLGMGSLHHHHNHHHSPFTMTPFHISHFPDIDRSANCPRSRGIRLGGIPLL